MTDYRSITDPDEMLAAATSNATGGGKPVSLIHSREPQGDAGTRKPMFAFQHISELAYDPDEAQWLVYDLLPAQGLATIFGKPKSYKSFVALDVALAIARGLPRWAEREIEAPGCVVYIACEGGAGVRKRVAAYCDFHGIEMDGFPFIFLDAKPNLGVAEGDAAELVRGAEDICARYGVKPVALFVDTLARTLHGASENGEGMACFCDNAETVAAHFNCLSVAVHHTPHEGDRMRGNSVLLGSVVSSWRVEKLDGMAARVTVDATKDGEEGVSWTVNLCKHAFARDRKGREVMSLVAESISEPAFDVGTSGGGGGRSVPPNLRLFMNCLGVVMDRAETFRPWLDGPEVRAVNSDTLKNEFYSRYADKKPDAKPDSKRRVFGDQLKSATLRGLIEVKDGPSGTMIWQK